MTLQTPLASETIDALAQDAPWRCRVVPARQLAAADIEQWRALAQRATDPNAYLTPAQVLAALQHLDPQAEVDVHLHERRIDADRWRLQGLALLRHAPADRHLPLGHLEDYHSRHAVLGGVLIARDGLQRNAEAMVDAWCRQGVTGIALRLCAVDEAGSQALIAAVRRRGHVVACLDAFERAMMNPSAQDAAAVAARLPSQTKRYLSGTRKADPAQRLSLRLLRGEQIDADAIERHLALEHAGWKGEAGTSMRSDPHDEAYFRTMFGAFAAADRAVLVELLMGDRVIHSSSNMVDGDTGFAFKVGFDPALAKLSPGILGEVGFLLAVREALPGLRTFDSGANATSFIASLWPDRRRIATLVLSTSRRADLALRAHGLVRGARRRVAALRARPEAPAAAAPAKDELRVELLEHDDDLARLEGPWRELERRVPQASLFATHGFIAASWQHLRGPEDRLHLIAVWQGTQLVAVAPFRLGRDTLHRLPVRTLDWIAMWDGDRPSVLTTLPTETCWSLVGEQLARSASRWDVLRLLEQPADLPLPASLLRLVHHQVSPDAIGHAIRLDQPFEAYVDSVPSSVRTNWRKRRRKLFEQAPASEVERIDATPEALPAAIERFVAIERQSWKGEAGIGVGADARHLAFYRDWFGRLGPQQASFHFLRRDGQDLAGLIVLRQGRTAYSRHITYAPAQASLSPAVILRAEVVRSLCQSGLDELDLLGMRPSAGEQRHKTDWSTHQRATTAHVLLRRRGLMLPVVLIKRVKQALRQRRDTLALD